LKTLLLSPQINVSYANIPPLGLGYIQSQLENNGHNTKTIDMFDYSSKKAEKKIRKENPDIVGISCFTYYRANSLKLAKICKKVNPGIKVILGGAHADFMYNQILSHFPEVDYIVTGEGEITTLQLVRAIEHNQSLKNIKGIVFRSNGEIIRTANRDPIQNLDEIPFPCYRDFELERYSSLPTASQHGMQKLKHTSIITSRGCPFNCQFCSTSKFWGRFWRPRTPKNVVDEIERLNSEYNIQFLDFADDTFTLDQKRVIEICKEIIKRKLGIYWYAGTRADCVSRELFKWMKQAGCIQIDVGVESGSPKILETINKRITVKQVISAFKMADEIELDTNCLFMVGNPGETKKTIEETIKLLDIINPKVITVGLTRIFPATPLYDIAKEKGMVNDDY